MKKGKNLKWQSMSVFVLFVVFIYMLIINSYMPMMADDYRYAMNWSQTHHLADLGEIISFQQNHYMEWGGRTIAHSIAQLMLFGGKAFFNVANSVVFMVFLLLLYWHANASVKKTFIPGLLMSTVFFVWFCLPTFGETTVWLLGACNYLWMTTLILAFLLPYRLSVSGQNRVFSKWGAGSSVCMFFFGIFAGWTNENSGLVLVLAAGLATLYCWKKKRFVGWMLWGGLGALIGYSLLIAAPGNYSRLLTAEEGNYSFFQNHFIDPLKTMGTLALHQLPIYICLLIFVRKLLVYKKQMQKNGLWASWKEKHAEILYSSAVYIGLSFVAQLAMFASPTFPQRAGFGAAAFLIIGVLGLLRLPIYENFILFRKEKIVCFIIFALWAGLAIFALEQYRTLYLENETRLAYIAQCHEEKSVEIQVRPFSIRDRSALGIVVVNDIGENSTVERSVYYARYFGFKTMSRGK